MRLFWWRTPPSSLDDSSNNLMPTTKQQLLEQDARDRGLIIEKDGPPLMAGTILPSSLARMVSLISKTTMLSIRLGTSVAETALDSARLSALGSLGVSRRVIENILAKAGEDTPGASAWTLSGIRAVTEALTLIHFLTSAGFHLATSGVETISFISQDVVHIINAVFGSTESSRAIASIIGLVQREMNQGAGVSALLTAFALFSILQSNTRHRTLQNIEMHLLWDVVVLDNGDTLSQQVPSALSRHKMEEDGFIKDIPAGTEYQISIDHTSTKEVTINLKAPDSVKQPLVVKLPPDAKLIREERNGNCLSVRFEQKQRRYRVRKGIIADSGVQESSTHLHELVTAAESDDSEVETKHSETTTTCTPLPLELENVTFSSSGSSTNSTMASSANTTLLTSPSRLTRSPSVNTLRSINREPLLSDKTLKGFPLGHTTYNMAKFIKFASASYGHSFMRLLGIGMATHIPKHDEHHSEHLAFSWHTGIELNDIILSSYSDISIDSKTGIPLVHFVAVDHESKAVVLTIRGTLGLEDILTDLTCDYETFEWGNQSWKCHAGILRCAQLLMQDSSQVLRYIRSAMLRYPDYGLILCGHSLGGSVSGLLGILLCELSMEDGQFVTSSRSILPARRRLKVFCYGPPACISEQLRKLTKELIVTVVFGLDIVPCLSLGLLRDFQAIALTLKNDKQGLLAEVKKQIVSQLSSRKSTSVGPEPENADYTWFILQALRRVMNNDKLVPPGEVYHISPSTVIEVHAGRTKRATRIVGKVVVDVEKRFSEPVLGKGVFHHSPVYYERALRTLEEGVSQAP